MFFTPLAAVGARAHRGRSLRSTATTGRVAGLQARLVSVHRLAHSRQPPPLASCYIACMTDSDNPAHSASPSRLRPGELIAVDWGSSNLRAWRLDAQGAVLEERRSHLGLLHVATAGGPKAFAQVLRTLTGPWLGPQSQVLMAGMVGSRSGWVEAPYVATPAGTAELAAALVPVPFDVPCWLVPGVAMHGTGAPDVMRGEESQLAGLPEGAETTGLAVMPGTHSKWVWREQGRIVWFRTFMTGEMFDLLVHHSILGRSMAGEALDEAAFEQGLAAAREGGALLEKLFAVRSRWLYGELPAEAQRAYLSGLLIGTECADGLAAVLREAGPRAAAEARAAPARLVASPALAGLYQRALQLQDLVALPVDEKATARGLWRIARQASALPAAQDARARTAP